MFFVEKRKNSCLWWLWRGRDLFVLTRGKHQGKEKISEKGLFTSGEEGWERDPCGKGFFRAHPVKKDLSQNMRPESEGAFTGRGRPHFDPKNGYFRKKMGNVIRERKRKSLPEKSDRNSLGRKEGHRCSGGKDCGSAQGKEKNFLPEGKS